MRRNEEMLKMKELADLYGSHLPMRLMTERNIMAQCGTRMHAPSYHGISHTLVTELGLQLHMGKYDEFTFSDWLNSKISLIVL